MNKVHISLAAAMVAAALGGCSQSALEPAVTQYNPQQTTLQFEAGTANIAGTVGLNAVETFRQSSGSSKGDSILSNAPTIVGPAGFVVPSTTDAGSDGGTNMITGQIATNVNEAVPNTTFNFLGLASATGINPSQLNNSSSLPLFVPYSLPFYASNSPLAKATTTSICGATAPDTSTSVPQLCYVGGPPAFTPPGHASPRDGTFPATSTVNPGTPGYYAGSGFFGYVLGFNTFAATAVSGTYTLKVLVPAGLNSKNVESYITKTATSTISAATKLPTWATAPAFTSDTTGGGTVAINFPTTSGVTEEYIEAVNLGPGYCQLSEAAPYYYTFKVPVGSATVTIPDNIGAAAAGATTFPHTFCTSAENTAASGSATAIPGDSVAVYGFAVDYPLAESAPAASAGQAAPVIVGGAGQDDITTSLAGSFTE